MIILHAIMLGSADVSCLVCADEAQSNSQSQKNSAASTPSTSGRKSAHQVAAEHQQEVKVIQDLLKQKGLHTLPQRLNSSDAELIRCFNCSVHHKQCC